eukprot:g1064.t1
MVHVLYPPEQRALLREAITNNSPWLSTIDRAELLTGWFAAFEAGAISVREPLQLVAAFHTEPATSSTVWNIILRQLAKVDERVQRDEHVHSLFKHFVRSVIEQAVKQVGWTGEGSHVARLSRGILKSAGVKYEIKEDKAHSVHLFQRFSQDSQSVHVDPNIRPAVFAAGVAQGGESAFDFLWTRYQKSDNSAEHARCLAGMGESHDTKLLHTLLTRCITKMQLGGIRSQDAIRAMLQVAANKHGQLLAWEFLQENWEVIFETHGKSSFSFSNLIEGTLKGFDRPDELAQAKTFFTGKNMGTGKRALERAYERIESNIAWRRRNWQDLVAFLTDFKNQAEVPSSQAP